MGKIIDRVRERKSAQARQLVDAAIVRERVAFFRLQHPFLSWLMEREIARSIDPRPSSWWQFWRRLP